MSDNKILEWAKERYRAMASAPTNWATTNEAYLAMLSVLVEIQAIHNGGWANSCLRLYDIAQDHCDTGIGQLSSALDNALVAQLNSGFEEITGWSKTEA